MQLYKRGKYFWVRFTMNGVQYRESTREATKTAAGERVKEILQSYAERGIRPTTPVRIPTLREFADGWFTEWVSTSSRLSYKSREYYEYGILLLKPQQIMSMRLDSITTEDADMIKTAHSASTHNCALRTLRRMLNLAARRDLIRRAPVIRLLEENRRTALIEPETEAKIVGVIEGTGSRRGSLRAALYVILDAGARPREIAAMEISHVNFERGFLEVPKSKTRAGARFLPLTDRLKAKLFAQIGDRTEGFVFPSPKRPGKPINSASLTQAWRTACIKAGISSDIKLYCARHTFGTDAMTATKNPFLVMKAMGHTELSTTARYQHHDIVELGERMNQRNIHRAERLIN